MLMAPTRELALQTHRVVKELGRYTDLRTAVLVGGDSMEAQFAELAANPDIIVATPGQPQAARRFATELQDCLSTTNAGAQICALLLQQENREFTVSIHVAADKSRTAQHILCGAVVLYCQSGAARTNVIDLAH